MKNYYWLKLHFDMLDDYKVGSLSDSLKWRFIQCLLVAGELGEGGWLPPLNQFAFRIRPMTTEQLQADLSRLAAAELVELRIDDTGKERWYLTNFKKRQKKISNKERQAAFRERQRQAEYNDDETELKRSSNGGVTSRYTEKTRTDKDKDKEQETQSEDSDSDVGVVFSFFENNIGQLNKYISDDIGDAIDEFGASDVLEAMKITAGAGKSWNYTQGILSNWRTNGKDTPKATKQDKAEKLLNIIRRHGRRGYRKAIPELKEVGLLDDIPSSKWIDLCNARPEKIQWMI